MAKVGQPMSSSTRRASRSALSALVVFAVACGETSSGAPAPIDRAAPAPTGVPAPTAAPTTTTTAPPSSPPAALSVQFLGIDGFLLSHGNDAILTAPLFTRPNLLSTTTGLPVRSKDAVVQAGVPTSMLANLRAVISGHAHYDHLLDVPNVLSRVPGAKLFSNASARHLLAAYAPDRDPSCAEDEAPPYTIARDRVVALDDPSASVVDWRNCPELKPEGAPLQGSWVELPNTNVRMLAVCSMHPDQIIPGVHYGAGSLDKDVCTPPTRMNDWLEGTTLAFLIDFLDPTTRAPIYRVYYQDAPSDMPVGDIPPDRLADKRIDLALLCVGSSDKVEGHPATTITALTPRYAIGGHWEDFFQPVGVPPTPIPLLDVAGWLTRASAAMPAAEEQKVMLANGLPVGRAVLPQPNDTFEIQASP